MTVLVAVTDSNEGRQALVVGAEEARLLQTGLMVVNLSLGRLDVSDLPDGLNVHLIDRRGAADRDPVEAVLDELADHPDVTRLVIGLRRRSPLGKAILGSISQRLLLESPVPVLAVKPDPA